MKLQVEKDLYKCDVKKEDVFVTESIQGNSLFPEELRQEVEETHKLGIHNETKNSVLKYHKEIKKDTSKSMAALSCLKMLNGIRAIKNERVIVTPHAYFLQLLFDFLQKYTTIIDEDIYEFLIVTYKDLLLREIQLYSLESELEEPDY